jgi:serine/threonine protein kinase
MLMVAIKVIKADYGREASHEIRVYQHVNVKDNSYKIVKMLDHFTFKNHSCIVFEMMDKELLNILPEIGPANMDLIKRIIYRIMLSV